MSKLLFLIFFFSLGCSALPTVPSAPTAPSGPKLRPVPSREAGPPAPKAPPKKRRPPLGCAELDRRVFADPIVEQINVENCVLSKMDYCGRQKNPNDCLINRSLGCNARYLTEKANAVERYRKRRCWKRVPRST